MRCLICLIDKSWFSLFLLDSTLLKLWFFEAATSVLFSYMGATRVEFEVSLSFNLDFSYFGFDFLWYGSVNFASNSSLNQFSMFPLVDFGYFLTSMPFFSFC